MRRELGMFIALALMCVALGVSNPAFVSQGNVLSTPRQVAMLAIFAIGLAFVIITGGIDLSVGSVIGLTGVIIAKISAPPPGLRMPLWIGIGVALGVALLIGLVQGLLITRLDLQPFIVTLGFMLMLRGVSQTIVSGANITITDRVFRGDDVIVYPSLTRFMGLVNEGVLYVNGKPLLTWPVLICLAVIAIATYVLHFTVFGRYVFAIGGNRDAARYSGIPVKRVETMTYVISAGLAGVAGVLYASYISQMSQDVGQAAELLAIAAAVLGGCSLRGGEGTVLGVVIGATMMRVIDNGINMFRVGTWTPDENWRYIIIGSVILIAVILDQVVHIVQERRRTRRAGAGAPAGPAAAGPAPAGPAPPQAAG